MRLNTVTNTYYHYYYLQSSFSLFWYNSPMNQIHHYIIPIKGYLVSLTINPLYSIQFGACIVLLSWIELMLMFGRIPSVGIYIFMSLNILKTLGRFLIVFSPLLIAFAATFYILLPSQPSFTNFPMALIKILGAQSFTLLKKKYSQFSRYLNRTFPWRN